MIVTNIHTTLSLMAAAAASEAAQQQKSSPAEAAAVELTTVAAVEEFVAQSDVTEQDKKSVLRRILRRVNPKRRRISVPAQFCHPSAAGQVATLAGGKDGVPVRKSQGVKRQRVEKAAGSGGTRKVALQRAPVPALAHAVKQDLAALQSKDAACSVCCWLAHTHPALPRAECVSSRATPIPWHD